MEQVSAAAIELRPVAAALTRIRLTFPVTSHPDD